MELGLYYIDLNKKLGEDFSEYKFDDQGIPLTRLHNTKSWIYNPITVCQYGLFHFNKFIRNSSPISKAIFLSQADWLLKNVQNGPNESAVWFYQFDLPLNNISAPWISGMAQGEALSVLLRASQISGENKYFKTARLAWRIFDVNVKDGGVISEYGDNSPVIEEYPSSNFPSFVLNGFIFAIFGIYDYSIYTQESYPQKKFLLLINSLKKNLFRYDCGYWTYYDLAHPLRLAAKHYHRIHIEQLKSIYNINNEPVFKEYYLRWQYYLKSKKSNLKWLIKKVHQKFIHRI